MVVTGPALAKRLLGHSARSGRGQRHNPTVNTTVKHRTCAPTERSAERCQNDQKDERHENNLTWPKEGAGGRWGGGVGGGGRGWGTGARGNGGLGGGGTWGPDTNMPAVSLYFAAV